MFKQNRKARLHSLPMFAALTALAMLICLLPSALAQTPDDYQKTRQRAIELVNESKFAEALPLFEKLAMANQSDGQVMYGLGVSLLMTSDAIKDEGARDKARARARAAMTRARELGVRDENLDTLIRSITPGGRVAGISSNDGANAAMTEASAAFAARDYQKAARDYERAAKLDPTLYEAALYTGNSHYALKGWDKAGEWFARAIAIDAERETAYRYWGDALMFNGKQHAARDKFIDAIIAEPYSQFAWRGLSQWAQRNEVKLAHPNIEIPTNVTSSTPGEVNITMDERAFSDKKNGSAAWMMYGLARAAWPTDKSGKLSERFAKAYPDEKVYRHSLAEEMEALRLVLVSLKELKETKNLEPSLAALTMLSEAGLLEPYILLARADQGIARDYPVFRKAHRDKLRRYLLEYVLTGGGK